MSAVWKTLPNGWRTWASKAITSPASWQWSSDGTPTARKADGTALDLTPPAITLATGGKLAAQFREGLSKAVAGDAHAAWYFRALLALAVVECGKGDLPCYGNCRTPEGKWVVCGGANAGPPSTVGYYQILKSTASQNGIDWTKLASDPQANHAAAFKLAKKLEGAHAFDFVALACIWNSGGPKNDPTNDFGVHMDRPYTLTNYVRAWDAVAGQAPGTVSSSSSSSALPVIAGLALAAELL